MKKATDFATKKEFHLYLVENKSEVIAFKKSQLKFTKAFGLDLLQARAVKALNTNFKDDVESGKITRKIIGNTYNWMDSYDDVLLNNVFAKSLAESQDKIWHLHDHLYQLTAKVGKPISIYEKEVDWADLGVSVTGKTMALFMESEISKTWNEKIFQMYLTGEINQHSVGMYYRKIKLAVNDPEWKDEYATWTQHIDAIGNKAEVIKQGYFYAVYEGDLVEISCVLAGANELTPTIDNKEKPIDVSSKVEAGKSCFYDSFVKAMHAHRV